MQDSAQEAYSFGPFRLDAGRRSLWRNAQEVGLPARAFNLLLYLIRQRRRAVTRAELMRELWPDVFVGDVNLSVNISLLRRALKDGAGGRYIETLPRVGYRFCGPLTTLPDAELMQHGQQRWLELGARVSALPWRGELAYASLAADLLEQAVKLLREGFERSARQRGGQGAHQHFARAAELARAQGALVLELRSLLVQCERSGGSQAEDAGDAAANGAEASNADAAEARGAARRAQVLPRAFCTRPRRAPEACGGAATGAD